MSADADKFFQMRVTDKFMKDVDELRKKEIDLPTRAELFRRLVSRALEQKCNIHEKVNG